MIHNFQNRRMVVSGVVVAPVRISGNLRGSRGTTRPADGLGLSRSPSLSQPFPVGRCVVRGWKRNGPDHCWAGPVETRNAPLVMCRPVRSDLQEGGQSRP
jgi:hypothetical protein